MRFKVDAIAYQAIRESWAEAGKPLRWLCRDQTSTRGICYPARLCGEERGFPIVLIGMEGRTKPKWANLKSMTFYSLKTIAPKEGKQRGFSDRV